MKLLKQATCLVVAMLLSTLAFAGSQAATSSKTIAQITASNPDFSILNSALKETGLESVLNKTGEYTVFAPTNAAFDKLPKGTLKSLLEPQHKSVLKTILLYHVIKSKVMTTELKPGKVMTMEGSKLDVAKQDGKVYVNEASEVTGADIIASNGVIHVVDRVLMPPRS